MGKRREQKWDWQWGGLFPLILSAFFLLGGLVGCLYAGRLTQGDSTAMAAYLADYLSMIRSEGTMPEYLPVLWQRLQLWLAVTLCGLTGLGLAAVPLLCAQQGFLLGYSAACMWRALGGRGSAAAAVLLGLPALLWAAVLFFLGCGSMTSAAVLLRRVWGRGETGPVFSRMHWLRVVLGAAWMALCAVVECSVAPALLAGIARWIVL